MIDVTEYWDGQKKSSMSYPSDYAEIKKRWCKKPGVTVFNDRIEELHVTHGVNVLTVIRPA